jgi:hypothetical protein
VDVKRQRRDDDFRAPLERGLEQLAALVQGEAR